MRVFVFGSNEAGRHVGGAAKFAKQNFDAVDGVGFGPTGKAFAIPTKDWQIKTLPLDIIKHYVDRFIAYALIHQEMRFDLTKVGCGLAGYEEFQIAPFFSEAPENVRLINKQFAEVCFARDWQHNIIEII